MNNFLPPEAKFRTILTARGKNLIVRIENLRMNDQADSDRAVSREEDNSALYQSNSNSKNPIVLLFLLGIGVTCFMTSQLK